MPGTSSRIALAALLLAAGPAMAPAQGPPAEADVADEAEVGPARPEVRIGFEVKAAYRDSEENAFRAPFGEDRFLRTVDPGSHLELPAATVTLDAGWGEHVTAHLKVDLVDLWDRNPTSSDYRVDVDEAWVRLGRETDPALLPPGLGAYVKVGKIPKFERQDDRHLESYGLLATCCNRFEDMGLEAGVDLGRFVYLKGSATQGNPVFMRDPNALAGDNGTEEIFRGEEPRLGSGIPILYDAEVEDFDADGDLEIGAGLGVRAGTADGRFGLDVLFFGYRRDLAAQVDLHGTRYGGDLDLLNGPFDDPAFTFPIRGDEKDEVGGNVWLYAGGLTLFGQVVDQEIAGLPRDGWEAEVSYRWELPLVWATGGRQLFPWIAPAARYSKLDNDFTAPRQTPSPSFAWDWEKWDLGVRLGLLAGVDLTLEHNRNRFVLGSGREVGNDESLAVLRWRFGS